MVVNNPLRKNPQNSSGPETHGSQEPVLWAVNPPEASVQKWWEAENPLVGMGAPKKSSTPNGC